MLAQILSASRSLHRKEGKTLPSWINSRGTKLVRGVAPSYFSIFDLWKEHLCKIIFSDRLDISKLQILHRSSLVACLAVQVSVLDRL